MPRVKIPAIVYDTKSPYKTEPLVQTNFKPVLEKYKLNEFNDLDYPAKPRWPLDEKAAFLKGAGVQL